MLKVSKILKRFQQRYKWRHILCPCLVRNNEMFFKKGSYIYEI